MVSKEYTTRGNVLIVSDDHEASITLANFLRNSGYFCNPTTCANDALSVLSTLECDVILYDLSSRDGNSIELLKTVRAKYPQTAIIMITRKDSISSAVVAMESGAHDYVIEPFDTTEVLARIEWAILRTRSEKIIFCKTARGILVVDCEARRISLAGKDLRLTDIEFRLLLELVQNAGIVLEYDELLTRVWGREYRGERGYLYDYIKRLRNQIEFNPYHPTHIITVPRVGYRFDCVP